MALYGPATATASVTANTNAVTITGMDLTIVTPGMTINFGARDRKTGDSWIIGAVAPSGTSGGTITLAGTYSSTLINAAFVIDTTGYLGTDASYAANTNVTLLSTLLTLFGPATNLFSGSRQLILDKLASTAIGRIGFAIAGRTWGDLAQRALTYTPTGGAQVAAETLAIRAFPDGTTPTDALLIDLATGGGDLRKASVTMASAATVDLGSAPFGKVAITGAVLIASLGPGKHLERLVHIVDGGGTLTHNATSLVLPGGANIATRAGDCFHATSDGSGNWRVRVYQRGDGTALILPASTQRASFRNRIINGAFSINQRGTSGGSASYAAGTYILDRWKAGPNGVTLSFFAVTGGEMVVQITAGTLLQIIEGGLYLPKGGSFILSWEGTSQARIYQGAASGTYATGPFTASITAGTNTTVEFGTGSLTRAQFEQGVVVSPYEERDDELRRCQRYFQVVFASIRGYASNTTFQENSIYFTPMRTTPTVTYRNNQSGRANLGAINVDPAATFPYNSARFLFQPAAAGEYYALNDAWNLSAEL